MTMSEIVQAMITGKKELFILAVEGKARKFALINILIVGVLFGLSNFLGIAQTTPELPLDGKFALLTPLIFSFSGIVSMSGAVLGFTMVYWAASKFFGGNGGLILVLELIGLAALPFWIISPVLNYALRFSPSAQIQTVLLLLLLPAFFWSYKLLRQSVITGQGISGSKAGIAVISMWVFSISAIYFFMP